MISPSDKEYQSTREIMLGRKTMDRDFVPLAAFIDSTFGARPVNIVYDTIDRGKRPRIGIYFEYPGEVQRFREPGQFGNFDAGKQFAIAEQFRKIMIEQGLTKSRGLFSWLTQRGSEKYRAENLLVYYSAFEPIARWEANGRVREKSLKQLRLELGCKDLWKISNGFSAITFFFYTDEQVKEYESNGYRKIWAGRYFDLLEPYNEFGYFKRDEFNVFFDSKENFDNNYESSWYYYYK